jgi:hypothetical protein
MGELLEKKQTARDIARVALVRRRLRHRIEIGDDSPWLSYFEAARRRLLKKSHCGNHRDQINRRPRDKAMAIRKNEGGLERAKKEFTISCLHEKGSMVTFAQF